jgi:DNA/RNA endonuclease YhcR with UshA esterase domain
MIERTLDAQVQMVEKVEFLTKEGHNLTVAVGVHPIYKEGKAIEIQGIVTTLHGLPASGPREARNLFGIGSENMLGQTQKANSFTIPTRQESSRCKQRHDKSVALVN